MRIAYLGTRGLPARHGGFEHCVEKLASALVSRGHRVTVYSKVAVAEKDTGGAEVIGFPPSITDNKYIDDFYQNTLSTLHAWLRGYDIYHFFGTDTIFHTLVPRLRGASSILTVDGAEWRRESHPPAVRKLLKLAWSWSGLFPSVLSVDNQQAINSFSRWSRKVVHIPYGVEPFGKSRKAEAPYILFVGRLVIEKGLDILLKAFSSSSTDLDLLIVGGLQPNETRPRFPTNEGGERVKFMGSIYGDEYWNLLSRAKVFVHPSRLEGMSTSLLNALSCKRCIIASDIPENRSILGNAAIYYPPEDWRRLAEILSNLASDPNIVSEMEKRSAERLENMPTWEEIASRYEATYRLMLKQRRVDR